MRGLYRAPLGEAVTYKSFTHTLLLILLIASVVAAQSPLRARLE